MWNLENKVNNELNENTTNLQSLENSKKSGFLPDVKPFDLERIENIDEKRRLRRKINSIIGDNGNQNISQTLLDERREVCLKLISRYSVAKFDEVLDKISKAAKDYPLSDLDRVVWCDQTDSLSKELYLKNFNNLFEGNNIDEYFASIMKIRENGFTKILPLRYGVERLKYVSTDSQELNSFLMLDKIGFDMIGIISQIGEQKFFEMSNSEAVEFIKKGYQLSDINLTDKAIKILFPIQ